MLDTLTTIKIHSVGMIRTEMFEGRQQIVAPVVLLVEGVHHGSGGPALYLAEELSKFANTWNGVPVPVFHPQDESGNLISANAPDVVERASVGRLWNVGFEDGKLKGEIWVDIGKAQKIEPGIIGMIQSADARLEVSTGLFSEDSMAVGEWDGERYESIVRNIRPDHLALLPGQQGACNWEDGCGVRANKGGDDVEKDIKDMAIKLGNEENTADVGKLKRALSLLARKLGIRTQEVSFDEIRGKLQGVVDRLDTPSEPAPSLLHYVVDVYDDYFVYEARPLDVPSNGVDLEAKMYRQDYRVDDDDHIELVGEPEEVREERTFVAAAATNNRNGGRMNMERKEKIDAMIANEASTMQECDRQWLEGLDDKSFEGVAALSGRFAEKTKEFEEKLKANEQDPAPQDPPANEDEGAPPKGEDPKPQTAEEFIANAPEGIRETLDRSYKRDQAIKANLVKEILDNKRNRFTKEQLEAKGLDELEGIAALAQVEVDYTGAVGAPRVTTPKHNERREDGTGVPDMPRIVYQDGKRVYQ